jgi:hypothetical protein
MSSGCAAIAFPSSAPSNIARFAPSPDGGISRLPEYDDCEQFLAGIDLILAGIKAVR